MINFFKILPCDKTVVVILVKVDVDVSSRRDYFRNYFIIGIKEEFNFSTFFCNFDLLI